MRRMEVLSDFLSLGVRWVWLSELCVRSWGISYDCSRSSLPAALCGYAFWATCFACCVVYLSS